MMPEWVALIEFAENHAAVPQGLAMPGKRHEVPGYVTFVVASFVVDLPGCKAICGAWYVPQPLCCS
jgi:hypothetical protein